MRPSFAGQQGQAHPRLGSVRTHTGHREADHVLNSHPVHRGPDHLFSHVGHVLGSVELHVTPFNKGHQVGQRILDRLFDFGLVSLDAPLNLNLKFLLSYPVSFRTSASRPTVR